MVEETNCIKLHEKTSSSVAHIPSNGLHGHPGACCAPLRNKRAHHPRRTKVSVIFTDVVGFTDLSSHLGADDVSNMIEARRPKP